MQVSKVTESTIYGSNARELDRESHRETARDGDLLTLILFQPLNPTGWHLVVGMIVY